MDSPKNRFLKTEAAKQFAGIAHSSLFVAACDVAMLEMAQMQPNSNDPSPALASSFRMQGAQVFRQILQSLADTSQDVAPTKEGLDYSK